MAEETGKHARKIIERKTADASDVYVHFSDEMKNYFSELYKVVHHPNQSDLRVAIANYADGCEDSLKNFLLNYSRITTSVREGSDDRAKRVLDEVQTALRWEGSLTLDVRHRKRGQGG